jgi:hypothetical protein
MLCHQQTAQILTWCGNNKKTAKGENVCKTYCDSTAKIFRIALRMYYQNTLWKHYQNTMWMCVPKRAVTVLPKQSRLNGNTQIFYLKYSCFESCSRNLIQVNVEQFRQKKTYISQLTQHSMSYNLIRWLTSLNKQCTNSSESWLWCIS